MPEVIFLITFFIVATFAAYIYALSRERQKLITDQSVRIKELQEELKLWQNKATPGVHPVSVPAWEPRDMSKDGPPIKILTRAEIKRKLADDPRLKVTRDPILKYQTVADKAKEMTDEI